MIVYVVGACGLILGTILGAALMQWRFDQHVQRGNALKSSLDKAVGDILERSLLPDKPQIHKIEMADGAVWYGARIYPYQSSMSANARELALPLTDEYGATQFSSLIEAQAVAEQYYQKKLSETVIKDTVV